MKIIVLILFFASFSARGQLLIDDFKTGNLNLTTVSKGESDKLFQNGNSILGKIRRINAKLNTNTYEQSIQLHINNGLLIITSAYNTNGTVYINYGENKNGLTPLKLDVSKFKSLKIEFNGKSTTNGLYVSLYTGKSRGVYTGQVPASEAKLVYTIPLSAIKTIGVDFSLTKIDFIRFQFDSRSKTGCNMAINKIWFE